MSKTRRNDRLGRGAAISMVAVAAAVTALVTMFAPGVTAETTARTAVIDANTLHVSNAQEDAWYSDGDEPYVAIIGYRSTLGVPGSTVTRYPRGVS